MKTSRVDLDQRLARISRRMNLGSFDGRSEVAQPYVPQPRATRWKSSTAKRYATVVLAPRNATDESIEESDYLAFADPGDNVDLLNAIFVRITPGGSLFILEGEILIDDEVIVGPNTLVRGTGSGTQIVATGAGGQITLGPGSTLEHLTLGAQEE